MLYTWNLHTIVNQLQLKKFFLSIWKGNVENVGFSGGGYCRNKGHQHGVCQELMRCCQQSPAAIPHAGRVSMNYLSFWFMTQNICSEILLICYVGKTSPGRSGSPGQTLVTWWVLGVLSGGLQGKAVLVPTAEEAHQTDFLTKQEPPSSKRFWLRMKNPDAGCC